MIKILHAKKSTIDKQRARELRSKIQSYMESYLDVLSDVDIELVFDDFVKRNKNKDIKNLFDLVVLLAFINQHD